MPVVDPARLERAFAILNRGCDEGPYAGAVAAVGGADGLLAVRTCGFAAREPEQVTMRANTVFDIASLTKLFTATAVLRLLEEGALVLETPVQHFIKEFSDVRVTIRHLLTHTSGLPGWRALYLDYQGWQQYSRGICLTSLIRAPGIQAEYSDLGFILLGEIIRKVTGAELPDYFRQVILEPLGMTETGFLPRLPRHRIAATERGNAAEMQWCGARAAEFSRWRSGMIWGEVNDGNCWYGLGGVASHAGLFSTASDLTLFARMWLGGAGGVLHRHTVALATRSHTSGMAIHHGLGWRKPPAELFPEQPAPCGDLFSPASFGHTGGTGTSLWIDPEKDLFVILLTNAQHPPGRPGLRAVRAAFHNAVVASLK